jgi:hypothetical protein
MKSYTKLNRLFEDEEIVSQEDLSELDDQATGEIDSEDDQRALPAEGESSADDNPMTLTVADFLERCRSIDPLVCMGIEKFIQDKMMTGLDNDSVPYTNDTDDEEDLSFSAQVEPSRDELDFPA